MGTAVPVCSGIAGIQHDQASVFLLCPKLPEPRRNWWLPVLDDDSRAENDGPTWSSKHRNCVYVANGLPGVPDELCQGKYPM